MGRIPEALRTLPGVLRSEHPTASFAAFGSRAKEICSVHDLEDSFGNRSPLGALYGANADVLLLGVGYDSCTSLHLAERRAFGGHQQNIRTGSPMMVDGARTWVAYSEPECVSDDFEALGSDFERDARHVRIGKIAAANARLMSLVTLVDYAVDWLKRSRLPDGRLRG